MTRELSLAQGGGNVAKEVMYADKAVYLPWRPRCAYALQIKPSLPPKYVMRLGQSWIGHGPCLGDPDMCRLHRGLK